MAPDKITTLLEQQLKTLGKKIRLDILRELYLAERPLSFSELQREINVDPSLINLSYHLNNLKEVNLVESPSKKYRITTMGQEILKKVMAIEEILTEREQNRLIRTSQYSTESFDLNNIKRYLIREAQMNPLLAEKISKIVRKRFSKTKIEYLTTPLIREYINAILIEEGCEEYRHKLTRLGVPPYDTSQLFNDSTISTNSFIKRLGGEVSEQYLLLNLLPRELADLYLSKKLIILHLDKWALNPLSIIINTSSLLNSLIKSNHKEYYESTTKNGMKASYCIIEMIELLNQIGLNCSNDLLLYNFDEIFNLIELEDEEMPIFLDILYSQMSNLNSRIPPSVDLAFNFQQNSDATIEFIQKINLQTKKSAVPSTWTPNLFIDYSQMESAKDFLNLIDSSTQKGLNNYFFYNGEPEIVNSALIRPELSSQETKEGQILLDKIFINLYEIALEANQRDELFFEILEERLYSCFEFFSYKQQFLSMRYKDSNIRKKMFKKDLGLNYDKWVSSALKSISFIGLNKAIKEHCGLELDRIKESENFAMKILKFIKKHISQRNQMENSNFCFTQPHEGEYFRFSNSQFGENPHKIIRGSSTLNLSKKILLFQRVNPLLDGGCSFELKLDSMDSQEITPKIKTVLNSNLPVFQIK